MAEKTSAETQWSEIERDRLAVYVTRSRVPAWYLPAIAVSTALLLASNDLANPWVTLPVVVLYAAWIGYATGKVIADGGMVPRFRGMPSVLARPLVVFMVVVGLVVVVGGYVALVSDMAWSFTILGGAVGVLTWGGGWLAQRVYEARAKRLADEAGIER